MSLLRAFRGERPKVSVPASRHSRRAVYDVYDAHLPARDLSAGHGHPIFRIVNPTGNPPPSGPQSRDPYAVLLYHYVGPLVHDVCRGLTVTPKAFERQVMALSAMGFSTIPASDIADTARGIPPRSILITFDDAYASLEEYAFPVLERAGFRATVFVPTRMIGSSIPCTPGAESSRLPLMQADRIRHWASRGFEFGSHTRTHADLTRLDPPAIADEVGGSREDLEALLGHTVCCFAYPFGRYDVRCAKFVADTFAVAFTVEPGLNDGRSPANMLRRTMVQHGDTVVDVCLRARYGTSALERFRTKASAVLRGTPAQ